jgi:hypothetical protein
VIKRAGVGNSGVLIYETDDSEFADSAIDVLMHAGIHCYRTGEPLQGGSSFTICIYIRNGGDFQRANEILVKLGASVDTPNRVSQKFILLTVLICALILALVIVMLAK